MWILNPLRPEQILFLSAWLLWGRAGWLIFRSNVFGFAYHKHGMSRRKKAARTLTIEDIVTGSLRSTFEPLSDQLQREDAWWRTSPEIYAETSFGNDADSQMRETRVFIGCMCRNRNRAAAECFFTHYCLMKSGYNDRRSR